MRLLMISDVYFPRVNGVSTSIMTFRRHLLAQGHTVTLIVPEYPGCLSEPEVLRIPSTRVPFDPEDRAMGRGDILRLLPQLAGKGYDLVHVHTPFVAHYAGRQLAQRLAIPLVESYHTFFEEYLHHYVPLLPKRWMKAAARSLARSQCNEVDHLIVPSQTMLERLREYGVTTKASIVPTGIELTDFKRGDGAAFRARHGIDPHRPLMLFVGRVAFEKNIGFLLEVTARIRRELPGVLLLIAGEGPALASLRERVAREGLGESVGFVGYLSRNGELQACYSAADLFVFASKTETQGVVLLEAMALGLPVVALAEMGTRDVLREGEGALIAHDDVDDFAQKALHLLRNPARRRELADAAVSYAQRWSAGSLAATMHQCYSDVTGRGLV